MFVTIINTVEINRLKSASVIFYTKVMKNVKFLLLIPDIYIYVYESHEDVWVFVNFNTRVMCMNKNISS